MDKHVIRSLGTVIALATPLWHGMPAAAQTAPPPLSAARSAAAGAGAVLGTPTQPTPPAVGSPAAPRQPAGATTPPASVQPAAAETPMTRRETVTPPVVTPVVAPLPALARPDAPPARATPAPTEPSADTEPSDQPTGPPPANPPAATTEQVPGGAQPAQAEDIAGVPSVLDSATLLINNEIVPLFGIQGLDGDQADGLREYVAQGGASVTCKLRVAPRYECLLPNGSNLSKAALVNGAALLGPGAPDDYVAERNDAIRNRRGIWGEVGIPAFEVSPAIPPALVPIYVAWRMAFPLWPVEDLGDGGYLVAGVPYAFVGGGWQRMAFDPVRGGWGWRAGGRWVGAPIALGAHFAQRFPHGAGLHAAGLRGEPHAGSHRGFGEHRAGGHGHDGHGHDGHGHDGHGHDGHGHDGHGHGAMGSHGMHHAGFTHPHNGGFGRGGFGRGGFERGGFGRGGFGMGRFGRGGFGMGRGGFGRGGGRFRR